MAKNTLYIIGGLAVLYTGIYFYQKRKREESNKKVTTYNDALRILDELDQ